MDLNLTDDQKLFQDTTARFLTDPAPLPAVRALEDDPVGFEPEWWQQAAELGWTSMLAPESLGGGSISGNGVQDLALAALERGRLVAAGPFVPTNAVVAMLGADSASRAFSTCSSPGSNSARLNAAPISPMRSPAMLERAT